MADDKEFYNFMCLFVQVASESVQNIRTVQSLGKEYQFLDLYLQNLVAPLV
jgi:hypothetical protein